MRRGQDAGCQRSGYAERLRAADPVLALCPRPPTSAPLNPPTMGNVLRIAVVDPKDASRDALKSMLLGPRQRVARSRVLALRVLRRRRRADEPRHRLRRARQQSGQGARADRIAWRSRRPTCAILVTSSSTDGNLILRTMRAGAKEFLTQPLKAEDLSRGAAACRAATSGRRRGGPPRLHGHRRHRRHRRRRLDEPGREPRLLARRRTKPTPSCCSTSTCASATPTCSSTRFPNTRSPTSPRTSAGST